jgi:hypothetical protein
MKEIMLGLILVSSSAFADSLVHLYPPPSLIGVGIAGRLACAGVGFNADSSVHGACHTVISSPCSGRGCQPVTSTTNYIASWDAFGNPIEATACDVVRHHLPQVDQITYLNGHSAADCFGVVFAPTPTVVTIDGQPFYYVSTDPVTGAELVDSNAASYLYMP